VVDRLHGEIPCHEFHHGLQPGEGRAHPHARKAVLGDWRIDHAARAEFLQQALGDLVGALVLRDFLAHDEHVGIAPHFLGHGVAQSLAHRHRHHFGAGQHFAPAS
jgi:hypothetical protein